jgi:hypothetical protein
LLNPAPALPTPGAFNGTQQAGSKGGNSNLALGGALRMRWSKADDFYLENLFKASTSMICTWKNCSR